MMSQITVTFYSELPLRISTTSPPMRSASKLESEQQNPQQNQKRSFFSKVFF